MKEQPKLVFTNKPDMGYIMQVLCDVLARQDDGAYEYSYTLAKKNNKKEDVG